MPGLFTFLRLFRFFWPFLADVFRHSSEDRKVMIARISGIALVAIIISWFYIQDKLDDIQQLHADKAQLSTELSRVTAERDAARYHLEDSRKALTVCNHSNEQLEEDIKQLQRKVKALEMDAVTIVPEQAQGQHTLPAEPAKPVHRAKDNPKKNLSKDRLQELN
nr:MAG TPA: Protein of unknown function (DUF2681) [Caudoviricetes sp.]